MRSAKSLIVSLATRAGLVVKRTRSADPWFTIALLLDTPAPVVFDVGANLGQTCERCIRRLPGASIYAFEPSPTTYRELRTNTAELAGVQAFNVAMGDVPGKLPFLELSSFFRPGPANWGTVMQGTFADVSTVDAFRAEHSIDRVHVLKTDTQGFDLAVLCGADDSFVTGAVDLVLSEITFTPMYDNAPRFDELIRFMLDRGFRVVGLWITHQEHIAQFGDVLFARSP